MDDENNVGKEQVKTRDVHGVLGISLIA